MKKMSSVFGLILLATTVAYAQEAAKPATPPPPPQEHIATLKLTNKLLKQEEKIQDSLNKAQTKLTIQQNKQRIFQIKAQAAINASNAK